MAKSLSNAVLDAGLDIVNDATELYLCTSEPTDRAGAIAASLIPAATPTFQPIGDGAGGGRSVETDASSNNTANAAGTASHVALCDASNLILVTTLASDVVISDGMDVTISAFTTRFADPT